MSISSEITRIQNGVSSQSSLITQSRTALIDKTSITIPVINPNSLSNNTAALQTILTAIGTIEEYPLTTYTISDTEAEENATRNGAVVTITGSTENSLALVVDPDKTFNVAYSSVNCGFTGLKGDGSWAEVFDYNDEGENTLLVTGATYWYFYPLDYTEGSYELHKLNITEAPIETESKTTTTNGTVTPTSGKFLSSVTVNVPTGTARSSSDLTVSGATVTVPAGLYSSAASKSVASGSVTVGTPTINTSTGVVTGTASVSAGYVSGTPTSKTLSLSTQAATTITPSTSSQTAVASGVYTTGAITVAAIPNQKSDSGNVTLNASTTSKSYAAGYYANAHGAQVTVYDGSVV